MLSVRKAFRGAWKRKHTAGLFSGTKEERKEEKARRKQEVYVYCFRCVGASSTTRLHLAHEQLE